MLTIRARVRRSRELVFRNSPVTMRRRSSGASGSSQRKRKESYAQEAGALPVHARSGSRDARCRASRSAPLRRRRRRPARRRRTKGGTLRVNQDECGLRLRRSAARLPDRRLVDALHDVDARSSASRRRPAPPAASSYPEAATAFPTVSKDGKTYTFHDPSGPEVLDGSPVTAASYPAVVGADPEPEDGLAARRQPRPAARRSSADRRSSTARPSTSRASRRRVRRCRSR